MSTSEQLAEPGASASAPEVNARQRLLWLTGQAGQLPEVPLPIKAMMGAARGMMEVLIRTDRQAVLVARLVLVAAAGLDAYVARGEIDVGLLPLLQLMESQEAMDWQRLEEAVAEAGQRS